MQLNLDLPELLPPQPRPAINIDAQTRQTASKILTRMLAQAVETPKQVEANNE